MKLLQAVQQQVDQGGGRRTCASAGMFTLSIFFTYPVCSCRRKTCAPCAPAGEKPQPVARKIYKLSANVQVQWFLHPHTEFCTNFSTKMQHAHHQH